MYIPFRFTVLLTISISMLACSREPTTKSEKTENPVESGYVVRTNEVETLIGRNGQVTIITSPATGSASFAIGTQQLLANSFIPIHQHKHADEAFYVYSGAGFGIVGDSRTKIEAGDALYIPRGVWHGFETEHTEMNVVWIISPPGLEQFFRETRVPPETPLRLFDPEQMEQTGRKCGIINKPV